ncbi:MAG: ROK family transcriptional regulator [Anaerolineales bacterium]|nr:ROK family transcriptional regulator [Anaerolineales bacterium]
MIEYSEQIVDSLATFPFGACNIRNLNRRVVLELIRFTPGGISRAELARQIDLTRSTVSAIVAEFVDTELVREAESGPTTGGRRPILLEINPRRGYVIGIDIGATHVSLVAADFLARVMHEMELPFDIRKGPQSCLSELNLHVQQLLDKAGLSQSQVLAIGVGVPGPVLAESGIVTSPPIMPGWDGYPIRDYLQKLWGCPVSVNNDAELGALGEWAFGAGRVKRHMAYIKVGSGIGAGLILDGRIYRGATGLAGEIGHLTIQEHGPLCTCGNHGCLEALAGGAAIARNAIQAVKAGRRTQLSSIKPVESITARDVGEAARLGDLVAQQIVADAGGYLGIAIAGVINLSNPSMVIIGGGVAQMGDLLLEPIRHVVRERCLQPAAQAVRITSAVLGRRSSSMGAVVQAIDTALYELTEGSFFEKGGIKEDKSFENQSQNILETNQAYAGV